MYYVFTLEGIHNHGYIPEGELRLIGVTKDASRLWTWLHWNRYSLAKPPTYTFAMQFDVEMEAEAWMKDPTAPTGINPWLIPAPGVSGPGGPRLLAIMDTNSDPWWDAQPKPTTEENNRRWAEETWMARAIGERLAQCRATEDEPYYEVPSGMASRTDRDCFEMHLDRMTIEQIEESLRREHLLDSEGEAIK